LRFRALLPRRSGPSGGGRDRTRPPARPLDRRGARRADRHRVGAWRRHPGHAQVPARGLARRRFTIRRVTGCAIVTLRNGAIVNRLSRTLACGVFLLCTAVLPLTSHSYHVAPRYTLRAAGESDYLAPAPAGRRLFIAHQDRVIVVDPDRGKVLGEIPALNQ